MRLVNYLVGVRVGVMAAGLVLKEVPVIQAAALRAKVQDPLYTRVLSVPIILHAIEAAVLGVGVLTIMLCRTLLCIKWRREMRVVMQMRIAGCGGVTGSLGRLGHERGTLGVVVIMHAVEAAVLGREIKGDALSTAAGRRPVVEVVSARVLNERVVGHSVQA